MRFAPDLVHVLCGPDGPGRMLTALMIPAIYGQHDEANNRSSSPPLVAHLLEIAQATVDTLHMVIGTRALARWAVQIGDHFFELVGLWGKP